VLRTARVLVTASLAAGFLACGDSQPTGAGELLLSWTFVDGRTCSEAGVPSVYVGPPGGDYTRLDCAAGFGRTVDVGRFHAGTLDVEAASVEGAPLYRARLEMPAEDPAKLSVVLVFVGGAGGP
jgi:hypothetical protein